MKEHIETLEKMDREYKAVLAGTGASSHCLETIDVAAAYCEVLRTIVKLKGKGPNVING